MSMSHESALEHAPASVLGVAQRLARCRSDLCPFVVLPDCFPIETLFQ